MVDSAREAARRRGHDVFDPIAEPLLLRDGVDIGPMFGAEGLRIRGKVFAFLGFDGDLTVKLPSARIDELVADGRAVRMVMRERELREWARIDLAGAAEWPGVVAEALAFVDGLTGNVQRTR